jgi:hypothetical protein
MKHALSPDIREVAEATHYRPAISLILPFEPKMNAKADLVQQLKFAVNKVDREVRQNYHADVASLVIQKLKKIVKELNFNTFKKSIAIYVSPVFEKVLYLDIPLEKKIVIDDTFKIRDLLYAKKEFHRYLVLLLSGKMSKVYLGDYSSFVKVKSNVPDHIAAFKHELPERSGNFSDTSDQKKILLNKFLQHTDDGLRFVLHAYPLPVFVMGTKKILGHFKALTKNEKSVAGYIHGNFEEASEKELSDALRPYILDWKKVKAEDLKHQMEKAADAGKLAVGMNGVWKVAGQHRGRLLIVEENFVFAAEQGESEDMIHAAEEPYNKFSYIQDAVDTVIEKVLEYGGDVEFVEGGTLKDYDGIALIQYY